MTIKENRPRREDGKINLDDRNYITLGMTYNEYLDLHSVIKDIIRYSIPGDMPGNRWVKGFLLVERDARLAMNLLKRLNKIT